MRRAAFLSDKLSILYQLLKKNQVSNNRVPLIDS